MSNVIQFPQREEPHLSGMASCMACQHRWVAVAPVGTVFMECPECSRMFGHMVAPVERDGDHWTCDCGNDLFRVSRDGMYCPRCGEMQKGF